MPPFSNKQLIIISLLLISCLYIATWLFPSIGVTLFLIFLLFGLVVYSSMIIEKYKDAFLQSRIPRMILIRTVLFEIIILLLALTIAALLGRHFAGMAAQHFSNYLPKLITGIVIGLSTGMVVGLLIKRATSHLVKP